MDTGGSVLAVALLHASFNASGSMAATGGWQNIPAMIVLTLLVVAYRRRRGLSATQGSAPAMLVVDPATAGAGDAARVTAHDVLELVRAGDE